MRLMSGLALSVFLMGCGGPQKAPTTKNVIVPTTGTFTEAEEAQYAARFDGMVKAFQSGKATADYDTEIMFGQDLKAVPLNRGTSTTLNQDLIKTLTNFAKENNSDSFILFEKGQVVSESYFGDITPESLINSKSLAKPLGSIAVGRAMQLGFIDSLDQSASDFIIEWKGTDKEQIKLRHLLQMRSGLLPQAFAPKVENVLNRAYLHPRHIEVIIHEYPLVHTPGSRYEYSNANSELISIIIERATSMPYQEWVAKEVLAPLGASGGKVWMNREGGLAHAGCCIGLTSETFLKLGIVILQDGKWNGVPFISKAFVTDMLTPTKDNIHAGMGIYLGRDYNKNRGAANPDNKSGFGGTLHSEPYIDKDISLFDGNGNQVVYILPSRDIVVMRLGPTPKSKTPWDNAYIPNTLSRALDR